MWDATVTFTFWTELDKHKLQMCFISFTFYFHGCWYNNVWISILVNCIVNTQYYLCMYALAIEERSHLRIVLQHIFRYISTLYYYSKKFWNLFLFQNLSPRSVNNQDQEVFSLNTHNQHFKKQSLHHEINWKTFWKKRLLNISFDAIFSANKYWSGALDMNQSHLGVRTVYHHIFSVACYNDGCWGWSCHRYPSH